MSLNAIGHLLRHDVRLAAAQRGEFASLLLFFTLIAVVFVFALGPEPELLARFAPGVLWTAALLIMLLSAQRIFADDGRDGTLEQLAMGPLPLWAVVLLRLVAHWLCLTLPLLLLLPLLATMLGVAEEQVGILFLSLLLGTPGLTALTAAGAAITLGARRGGVLLAVVVLPLYVPLLIFALAACEAAATAGNMMAPLLLLAACSVLALLVCPPAAAAGLRAAME